jgi:hypothetical protein
MRLAQSLAGRQSRLSKKTKIPGGYRVDDANGNRLGYFYFWDDPAGRYRADVLSPEEAKRMAEDFAALSLRL